MQLYENRSSLNVYDTTRVGRIQSNFDIENQRADNLKLIIDHMLKTGELHPILKDSKVKDNFEWQIDNELPEGWRDHLSEAYRTYQKEKYQIVRTIDPNVYGGRTVTNMKYSVEDLSGIPIGIAYNKQEAIQLYWERYNYIPNKYRKDIVAEPFITEESVDITPSNINNVLGIEKVLKKQGSTAKLSLDSVKPIPKELTPEEELNARYERFQKTWKK